MLKIKLKELFEAEAKRNGKSPKKYMTQAQFAIAAGVSRPTVSRWMKGYVDYLDRDSIEAFCSYFDCEIGDLLEVVKVAQK